MKKNLFLIVKALLLIFTFICFCGADGCQTPGDDNETSTTTTIMVDADEDENKNELITILNSLEWGDDSYPEKNTQISQDVQIDGTITLYSEDIQLPVCECPWGYHDMDNSDCCLSSISFLNWYDHEGISIPAGESSSVLTMTNVKLRFRKTSGIFIGMEYYDLTIRPPSDYICDSPKVSCDEDNVCYEDYSSYCYNCLGLSSEECECRNENGILDDGTECLLPNGDTIINGYCRSGLCEIAMAAY